MEWLKLLGDVDLNQIVIYPFRYLHFNRVDIAFSQWKWDTIFCNSSNNDSNFRKIISQHVDQIKSVYAEKNTRKNKMRSIPH